jgi:hypothetical protein
MKEELTIDNIPKSALTRIRESQLKKYDNPALGIKDYEWSECWVSQAEESSKNILHHRFTPLITIYLYLTPLKWS